jgi:ribosome-binding protein aMBF1 (putative translation factor)
MKQEENPNNLGEIYIGEGGYALLAMADNMFTIKKQIVIARQVRSKMKELGWDNNELSKRTDISKPIITKIVRGDYNLDLKKITILERILGIKINLTAEI